MSKSDEQIILETFLEDGDLWPDLIDVADEYAGFYTVEAEHWDIQKRGEVIRVITRGPSGQHYRWFYFSSFSGLDDECEGSCTPVRPVPQTITDWQVVE